VREGVISKSTGAISRRGGQNATSGAGMQETHGKTHVV